MADEPRVAQDEPQSSEQTNSSYIALSPFSPCINAVEDVPWTILSTKRGVAGEAQIDTTSQLTIRVPPAASGFQSFLKAFEALNPDKHGNVLHKPIDVRALSVRPVYLST